MIRTKITTYQKQVYIVVLLFVLWCIFIFVQYQYYYGDATTEALNRFIRHEALLLEQQQQLLQQQQHIPGSLPQISGQRQSSLLQGIRSKISPQQLRFRHGPDTTM